MQVEEFHGTLGTKFMDTGHIEWLVEEGEGAAAEPASEATTKTKRRSTNIGFIPP